MPNDKARIEAMAKFLQLMDQRKLQGGMPKLGGTGAQKPMVDIEVGTPRPHRRRRRPGPEIEVGMPVMPEDQFAIDVGAPIMPDEEYDPALDDWGYHFNQNRPDLQNYQMVSRHVGPTGSRQYEIGKAKGGYYLTPIDAPYDAVGKPSQLKSIDDAQKAYEWILSQYK